MMSHLKSEVMKEKALLIGVGKPNMKREDMLFSLEELKNLVSTAGGETVFTITQELKQIHPATFIGKGKVAEAKHLCEEHHLDLVVIDDELSPVQNRNLENEVGVRVLDRTAVILDIFAMRAQTKEGRLQVELAQLEYLAPRLVGSGKNLSQQVGRIGTRGPGETALEQDRRRIRERITQLKREVKEVRKHRTLHRKRRDKVPLPLISLVGYTNAGKSTLMKSLTKADVLVEDKLFATLDPTVRKLKLPSGRIVLLADTVGFIHRLPHQLVDAFQATFEEVRNAHLLLHLVDVSHHRYQDHIAVVSKVLEELQLSKKLLVLAYNKVDTLDEFHCPQDVECISALEGTGISHLLETLDKALRKEFLATSLFIPYERGDILSHLFELAFVKKVERLEKGIKVECDLQEKFLGKYKAFIQVQQ